MDYRQSTTLLAYLEMVPDPRKRRGKRYSWAFLLTVTCMALASGESTVWGIAQWAQLHGPAILAALKAGYGHIPSPSTFYRTLHRVDIEALEAFVTAYGQGIARQMAEAHTDRLRGGTCWHAVAADGKDVRGAAKHGPKVHLVSLVEHGSGLVLGQRRVPDKAYEPYALSHLLDGRDLTGTVITMDALYTHADMAQQILDQGGHYFMVVKNNQPLLREDIASLFAQEPLPGETRWEHTTHGKGHGRLETRRVASSELLNDYLDWPGVGQVVERTCTRVRLADGRASEETSYAITSLGHDQASVEELATLWRAHWTIENRVHYVRDETLGEDRGQIAKGNAPQALAALRNALLTALRARGWDNIAQALRYYAVRATRSFELVTTALT